MTSAQLSDARIDTYMARLEGALAKVLPSEREDILREIRAHILDSTAGASDRERAVERVLRLLGTPEELASRYSTDSLLTRASHSFSPVVLLGTCWRWAKIGMKGTLAFLLALFGYTTSVAMFICVLLKPIMPSKIGLWIGPDGLNVGVTAHPEVMHELLGRHFVPVIAGVAFLIGFGTTQALRRMMRRRNAGQYMQHSQTTLSV